MDRLNVKFKKEIAAVLLELKTRQSTMSMKNILEGLKTQILDNIEDNHEIDQVEREWKLRVTEVAKTMGIKLANYRDGKNIITKIINQKPKQSRIKSSPSGSSIHNPITLEEKQRIVQIYEQMDAQKMWKLSSGKIVEKQMMKMAERCGFEHPCHSFIFDTEDQNWLDFFTKEELNEIKSQKSPKMPQLPTDFTEFLNDIKQQSMDDMYKCLSTKFFHPKNETARHWLQKSLIEGIELHMSGFLNSNDYSERDLMSRVWRLILTSLDFSQMTIREEIPCTATAEQKNKKRKLSTTTESIDKKSRSKVPDQIVRFGEYEIGLTEGAKMFDKTGNKFLDDARMKVPKLLKDMLSKLLESAPSKKNLFKTIGLVTSKLHIEMMVMDFPESYVFRVLHTKSYSYPAVFPLFIKEIRPCLELIWLARMIMEEIMKTITSPGPQEAVGFNFESTSVDLPTFYSKK